MASLRDLAAGLPARASELLDTLRDWPWTDTLATLARRFREDRLGLTAGSLTFTTLIALVPLFTVTLAIFSAFPRFAAFKEALEAYFLQALVPEAIARPVLGALADFADKARGLGGAGAVVLAASALSTMLTIDRSLNAIWRVRRPRPFAQRILVYWAALTLGPLVIGVGLSASSYALGATGGAAGGLPDWVASLVAGAEFGLMALGVAALFHYVPHTWVRWRHALAGGVFVAAGFAAAKAALAWYLAKVPTLSVVYGAFATLPILLLWIYLGWVIVLLGAVIAAYAPSLQMRVARRPAMPGHRFELALAVLRELAAARSSDRRGLSLERIAELLRADPLQLEPIVERLLAIDWVARLDEDGGARLVLLVDPAATSAAPLVDVLLLPPGPLTAPFRERAGVEAMRLAELLG